MDACTGCMTRDRRLKVLGDNKKLYQLLLGHRKKIEVSLCWECEARLKAVAMFQSRIRRAQKLLANVASLSTLTTHLINSVEYVSYDETEIKLNETNGEIKLELPSDDEKNVDLNFYDSDEPVCNVLEFKNTSDNKELVKTEVGSIEVKNKIKRKFYAVKRQRKRVKIQPEEYTKYVFEIPLKSEDETEKPLTERNNDSDPAPVGLFCRLCGARTDSRRVLEHFRRRHRHVHECGRCGHAAGTRADCVRHLEALHRRLTCDACGKRTASRDVMAKHIQDKHVPAACVQCDKRFPSVARLRAHATYSHDGRDCYCVQCDRHFPSRKTYNNHMREARPHVDRPKIPCPDCGKLFAKKYNLRNHRLTVHAPVPTYGCTECGKVLSSKHSLSRHSESVHRGVRPVKSKMCPFCGRTFHTNRILTHHVRTHTGERPHACPRCPAAFAQKHAMTVHVRNVHQRREPAADRAP